MSSAETTEMKLNSTPTGGVDASHSPYYRRLLSAGYKGYLQGTIGGASLYGAIGLVIGACLSVAAWPLVGATAALALIPAAAGMGVLKGASTFGDIGSTAAINAESADLSEQRRYLLDRYHDLPDGPEGDREAAEIRKELIQRQDMNKKAPPFFHWKTVAICALAGAALAGAFLAFAPAAMLAEGGIFGLMEAGLGATVGHAALAGLGALAGALTGAVVGVDRYYVRKWFDVTEGVVHSSPRAGIAAELNERGDLVSRLRIAAQEDQVTKESITKQRVADDANVAANAPKMDAAATATPPQLSVTEQPKPDNRISAATREDRVIKLQQAMEASL